MTSENDAFTAYAVGMVYASACTNLTDAEATARMNREHSTGISSDWAIADEAFASGDANGRPCDRLPDTHRHILFVC